MKSIRMFGTTGAAIELGLTNERVIKLIQQGKLKASKLPSGRYRIRPEDLEAVLEPVASTAKER